MTEAQVIQLVAQTLQTSPGSVTADTKAGDLAEWDSMGTMSLMVVLNADFGVELAPGQTDRLRSVAGIISVLREHGKLT